MPLPLIAPVIPGVASAVTLAAVAASISYLAAQGRVPKVPLNTVQEKLDWVNEQYTEIQREALDDLQIFGSLGAGLLNSITGANAPTQSHVPASVKAKLSGTPKVYSAPKPLFGFASPFNANPFSQIPTISPSGNTSRAVPPPVVPARRLPPKAPAAPIANSNATPKKVQTSQQGSTNRVYGQLSYSPIENRVHENIVQDTSKFESSFSKSQIQSLKQFQDWAKGADLPFINTGLTFIDKPGIGEIPVWGTGISELMNQLDARSKVKHQIPSGNVPTSSINTPLVVGGLGVVGVGAAATIAASPAARVRAANTLSRMNRGITSLRASVDLSWILSVMTFAATVHNAALLSTDIVRSLIGTFDNMFNLLNIKGADGQSLQMSKLLSQSINDALVNMLGVKQVAEIKAKWVQYSTVYRASAAVLGTLSRIQQNTLSVIEVTGSYVGRIGNALRRYGAVGDDAYNWMSEQIAARSVRYESLNNSLQNVSQASSDLNTVSASGVDTKDAIRTLDSDLDFLNKSLKEANPTKGEENTKVKQEEENRDKVASTSAPIKPEDE